MSIVLVIAFTILMLLAIPVGHALIIAAGLTLAWQQELPLMIVAQQMYQQTQSFPMLALPFFMMAGSLMLGGKLGAELLSFATKAMQRWRGGPCRPPSWRQSSSAVFREARSPMLAPLDRCSSRGRNGRATRPGFVRPTMPRRRSSTS
jgi:hypothetical protein